MNKQKQFLSIGFWLPTKITDKHQEENGGNHMGLPRQKIQPSVAEDVIYVTNL